MQQLSSSQSSPEVPVNENFETLEHVATYGKAHATTSALTWGYYGGRWGGFSVAAGTLSLTASTTNYIVVAIATGVISVSTASTNWNDTTNYVRVYKLTTSGSAVTATEDHRAGPGGIGGGSGGGSSTSLSWKDSVRVASTANVTIASALVNGATMDGVTLATGDRVLLKDQSTGSQNGIYVVVASGAASRSTDADSAAEVLQASFYVQEGTLGGDRQFVCTTNAPITLGSTSLTFTVFSSGGSGDALVANPLSQFASTTSLQLLGVISDETGTGALVFASAPTLVNPVVGTQSAGDNSTKAASTAYVKTATDAAVAGLSWKQTVRAATTVAGTLATSFENGDAIDGVTLVTGDRILIKNQAGTSENGIYIVAASGAPTRATDADSGAELVNASVYVSEGSTLADTQWVCTTNATITVGSTGITFAQFSSGGGTLSYFAETGNTASPNATINTSTLTAVASSSSADMVLAPKGTTGALIIGPTPDSTSTGGNKRGTHAFDGQIDRTLAANVASGANSALFGFDNKASGASSFAAGNTNVASGTNAVALGTAATASGSPSLAFGTTVTASGTNSQAGGTVATASGAQSYAFGASLNADADYSHARGYYAETRGIKRVDVWASGRNNTGGDKQTRRANLGVETTNNTITTLTTDGAAASTNNQFVLNDAAFNQRTFAITGIVAAKQAGTSECSMWEIKALAYYNASVAVLVGSPTVTQLFNTAGNAASWVVTVDLDATNIALRVRGTGTAATTVRWNANVTSTEVF